MLGQETNMKFNVVVYELKWPLRPGGCGEEVLKSIARTAVLEAPMKDMDAYEWARFVKERVLHHCGVLREKLEEWVESHPQKDVLVNVVQRDYASEDEWEAMLKEMDIEELKDELESKYPVVQRVSIFIGLDANGWEDAKNKALMLETTDAAKRFYYAVPLPYFEKLIDPPVENTLDIGAVLLGALLAVGAAGLAYSVMRRGAAEQ